MSKYADNLNQAEFRLDDRHEARIERLFVHSTNEEEIRFSWWKNGRFMPRPLDLSETHLLELMRNGVAGDVFSPEFRAALASILAQHNT